MPGMIALIALIILSKTVKYIRKRRKEKEGGMSTAKQAHGIGWALCAQAWRT